MASKRPSQLSGYRPLSDSTTELENSPPTNNTSDDQVPPRSSLPPGILRHILLDVLFLSAILIMLIWPWLFFGVVWVKSGIETAPKVAVLIRQNPHTTTYFITFISSLNTIIITFLYSVAIVRFSQEWATHAGMPRPLHIRTLLALRHRRWRADGKGAKNGWGFAVLVFVCFAMFPNLTSSASTLITPAPFNRASNLTRREVDFSSTAPECVDWFKSNPIGNDNNLHVYNGLSYIDWLGENLMVDVLEAGRGSVLSSIASESQSLTFNLLGAKNGLHILESTRGVLPLGPDGIPAFETLDPISFEDSDILTRGLSYNYILDHQGITAEPSCQSTGPTSPIEYSYSSSTGSLTYSVPNCTALGQTDVLIYTPNITIPDNSHASFLYWACRDATQLSTYYVYLRGLGGYAYSLGNITCTISQLQPATYSVMYESTKGFFTTSPSTRESAGNSSSVFTSVMTFVLQGLGNLMWETQNSQDNLIAQLPFNFGFGSYPQAPGRPTDAYLKLYGLIFKGIVEYFTTYTRLLYSTVPTLPSSCHRPVNGSLNYEVLGWSLKKTDIFALIPITVANGVAFFVLLAAMCLAKRGDKCPSPWDSRPVAYDPEFGEEVPDEWATQIVLDPVTLLKSAGDVGESASKEGFNYVRSDSGRHLA